MPIDTRDAACRELEAAAVADERAASLRVALERGEIWPVARETGLALRGGDRAITSGPGLVLELEDPSDRVRPRSLIVGLAPAPERARAVRDGPAPGPASPSKFREKPL